MFENRRTKQKQQVLRAYKSESEDDAKRRLEGMGWQFNGVDYTFANNSFTVTEDKAEDGDANGD